MSNQNVTNFFSTIVAAANIAAAAPTFSNAMIDLVFSGYEPAVGTVGQTIDVVIPTVTEADATDIGSGALNITDTSQSMVALAVSHKYSVSKRIQSIDQARSERDLAEFFMKPLMETLLRKVNSSLTAFISSSSFTTNAVTGSGGKFTRLNLTDARQKLFDQGAPDNNEDLYLITSSVPYYATLADSGFNTWSNVGETAAVDALQRGVLVPALGAKIYADQKVPVLTGPAYPSLFAHKYAIAARYLVEPSVDNTWVKEAIVYPRPNLPVKIQAGYDLVNQGTIIHLSTLMGSAVTREAFGCLITV